MTIAARKFLSMLLLAGLMMVVASCGGGSSDAPAPTVTSFTAQAATVARGQSTLLQWNVKDADRITVNPSLSTPSTVSGSSISVAPTTTTTYTLVASRGQVQVSKQVTVNVIENIQLQAGASYFSVDGKPQFITLRNIVGRSTAEYAALFDKASKEGTRVVRVHLSHAPWGMGYDGRGQIDPTWLSNWDQLLDKAALAHLYVIPVFSVWADWNDGSKGEAWHVWNLNPMNTANGGTALTPQALFQAGNATQTMWFSWLGCVVQHWSSRPNILAWETFSELDIATGANESSSVAFASSAAAVVRRSDAANRPVTASLGNWSVWPSLYSSTASDITQVHAYGPYTDLDVALLADLQQARTYNKPVLIGESGLDWAAPDGTTLTTQPQGVIGVRNASWAALVSGAANGRALWWEDSYAISQNGDPSVNFVMNYPAVEAPLLALTAPLDFTGMLPVRATAPASVVGGVIGNASVAIGWYRSQQCGRANVLPPNAGPWNCTATITGINLSVQPTGAAQHWSVAFYNPATGSPVGVSTVLTVNSGQLTVALPPFAGAVAFKLLATN